VKNVRSVKNLIGSRQSALEMRTIKIVWLLHVTGKQISLKRVSVRNVIHVINQIKPERNVFKFLTSINACLTLATEPNNF